MSADNAPHNVTETTDPDPLAVVDAWLASLPHSERLAAAVDEGRQVAAIAEPLGLPPQLMAAVRVYPLYRDGFIDKNGLENNKLAGLSQFILGLGQLDQFVLPENWRPGEVLAVQQSEALRKMLLAVVSDVRLVLVRIAVQLFRLRNARNASREVQQALALESREIYAALANRLGVWQLKWELEDLAFRYLDPEDYARIAQTLQEKRAERVDFIDDFKRLLKEQLDKEGIRATISGRPKHIYSIWRKMQKKDRGIDALYDIRAVRILVDSVSDCYAALGIVHNLWSYIRGEFDDYIANPKDNDYQSLHTAVIGPEGKTIEIQIRTHDMHRHAELGVAAHWRYKEGGGTPAAFDQKIRFLRQLLEPTDTGGDLIDQVRDDFFEDRVYALSPRGDVVELPAKATPLDFAYHVHTLVGHRCRGAKVNGRIVPLTYHINNGDQIEIITGSKPQPSRDWLSPKAGYLASARSRAKVRNWFRQQDRDHHQRQGREILDREQARLGAKDIATDKIAVQLKHRDTESLCVALGAGDLTSASIATAVTQLRGAELPEKIHGRRTTRRHDSTAEAVAVSGVDDLMSHFARCCRPVPPEPIIGYITVGRGVTIHRQDCGNFQSLNERYPERIVEIDWGKSEAGTYPVDLTVYSFDRAGLIRDITGVLADAGANVMDLKSHTDRKSLQVIMDISIEISDLPTLTTAIAKIEQIPSVVSVRRRA
ncbi:MAG TPA: bifunctional (p)ppGpp synthetase/guanosine-3',5'-bis(diphosphate) 3'-pyrophosphohydrolase [Woeseiaceae bacterium]